ncbi:hypothetical protein B0H19DRAFT_1224316 [Mycena capillaripes]|nr:hypothetical protein B0H19DRAFT_1224316 [Mycena capillaripes]
MNTVEKKYNPSFTGEADQLSRGEHSPFCTNHVYRSCGRRRSGWSYARYLLNIVSFPDLPSQSTSLTALAAKYLTSYRILGNCSELEIHDVGLDGVSPKNPKCPTIDTGPSIGKTLDPTAHTNQSPYRVAHDNHLASGWSDPALDLPSPLGDDEHDEAEQTAGCVTLIRESPHESWIYPSL